MCQALSCPHLSGKLNVYYISCNERRNSYTPMSTDVLSNYFKQIQNFESLDFEQEQTLAKRWVDKKDQAAFQKLMESYLRLVVKVALSFRGYGLPLDEMVQEGNIGLMQAIARFDPSKGFRLSTYAMWWIRAQMQEFVLNNWSLVKIGTTSSQKKLFFNLRRLRNQLNELEGSEQLSDESVAVIAKELGVKTDDVVAMNQRLGGDTSIHNQVGDEDNSEWVDFIVEERPNQEEIYISKQLQRKRNESISDALKILDDRERSIFVARRLNGADKVPTLEQLSQHMGISRERVRQLEVRAFDKVKKHLSANMAA